MKAKLLALTVLLLLACPFEATMGESGEGRSGMEFGVRAGYSINPDQFVIGAQAVSRSMSYGLRLAPSVDLGFGDNITTYLFNLDVHFLSARFPKSSSGFYLGVGPAIAVYDFSDFDDDTEIGVNIVGGLRLPMGSRNSYNIEGRFGFGDMPDFRILLGVLFGG
jgi:hypothetical protein